MLKIRLTRVGKKNSPSYRVVVAEQKKAVKRKFIEIIGNYNPTLKPKQIVINKERAIFWMGRGAQASDTVNNLMCDLGILNKKDKVNKVYGKKLTKKQIKEGAGKEGEAKTENEKVEDAVEETAEESAQPSEPVETPTEKTEGAEEAPAENAEKSDTQTEEEKRVQE